MLLVLIFATLEPFAVADGVDDVDEGEDDLVMADLIGHPSDRSPVEPGMTMLVKPGMTVWHIPIYLYEDMKLLM